MTGRKCMFLIVMCCSLLYGCVPQPLLRSGTIRLVKVFYIPFNVQTYNPTTIVNIEESATCVCQFSVDGDLADRFRRSLVLTDDEEFDPRHVRMKFQGLLDDIVYIDTHGCALFYSLERDTVVTKRLAEGSRDDLDLIMRGMLNTPRCACSVNRLLDLPLD